MKISNITLNNFRQYYGLIAIDLATNNNRNIIVVGGKTGYGKTNFLVSIVWCLYGEKISQVDDSFKRVIKTATNYQTFIKDSLNSQSREEGNSEFFVEIRFEEIEYPDNLNIKDSTLLVKRIYNSQTADETLQILNTDGQEIFNNQEDKINFINDFLIPLEAAKFVFFDAEKIASWAELKTKDAGTVLNDALGKLLGLDLFEKLKDDLNFYIDNLRKESASADLRDEIDNAERAIMLNSSKVEKNVLEIEKNDAGIFKLKRSISDYQLFLNQNSRKEITTINRDELHSEIIKLTERKNNLEKQFNELSELMPLAILSGKIEEVIEQIEMQGRIKNNVDTNAEIKIKLDNFIEQLFNKPPEPENGAMSFKNKVFYSEKAQSLLNELFNVSDSVNEIDYELDLTNADKDLINKAFLLIQQQSKELFESTISDFNSIQIALHEKEKQLKVLDSDLEDEAVLEVITKKDEAERDRDKLISQNGAMKMQNEKFENDIVNFKQKLSTLLQRVRGNQAIQQKITIAKNYANTLQSFIDNQKREKSEALASKLLEELQKIMHKNVVRKVRVEILPDNAGLQVKLFDVNGQEIQKELLSAGEKQIYISCLIKSILTQSIQNYPIFIDTPLGRLDHEHIENILVNYYPDLSSQVVLLSTNNEITPRRYSQILNKVSKAYLIMHEDKKSYFKTGYFQSYENQN